MRNGRTSMMGEPSASSNDAMTDEHTLINPEASVERLSGNPGSRVFCVVVWIPFTIGMVVIGTLYMNRCATDPKIPIYLIVAGSVFLFGVVLLLIHKACQKLIFVLEVFLCIFSVCWFALGSIWVFTIYNDASKDCHYILFNFAFGALLFQYILLAFILSFFCVCSSCLSFMAARFVTNVNAE
ncbi:uncharacterized protein LOC143809594 [Ranitomeya variabilis]|uniref:uncharacterized protein LOC143809594 n=1 Tax=Ranitomeya variabilis TaxID=490064 RepID=UPI004056887A